MVELEPMTLLPALAMVTSHIGLVTTASTTYNEPYNLARKFATLDLISKGRAGWNVVASWSEHEAQNFGLETTLDYDTRYARSAEFVEVVKGLWDSWDDGALLFDKAAGRYFDEAKMHVLNHQGRFFKVRGPLNVAGMPQGHPVIVQAGASEQGRELGAATAEVIYAINGSLEGARGLLRRRERADGEIRPRAGRSEDHAGVLSGRRPHARGSAGEVRRAAGVDRPAGRPRLALQRVRRPVGLSAGRSGARRRAGQARSCAA